jgi:2-methylcitrate dehydratase PrpD
MSFQDPELVLAQFIAELRFGSIPPAVQNRAEDLFLDWIGSALAGKGAQPVETIAEFAATMGPEVGRSEILINRKCSSPFFAAMINAAASHVVEQDDVHNGSVFHPATVVFPVALAMTQDLGRSGADLLTAVVAGYEVGIRVGEFLGRSHYKTFHTTGTAGTLAAAATAGHLLRLSPEQMLSALGSAGTQAAGLWEFLRDAADSKQLHTAHAATAGLTAAYLARGAFTGARHILTGPQGMAAGMSGNTDATRLTEDLGRRWALRETSFKYHASCRHTHPSADALQQLLKQYHLAAAELKFVTAHVHQAALDVLGSVTDPKTIHQSKFSMGTVLALIALYGRAGLTEFDAHYKDPAVALFRDKVRMVFDREVDRAYPARWIGKISADTIDGRHLESRVEVPKGDPGNTLSRLELEQKALQLAGYHGAASEQEMRRLFGFIWSLRTVPTVNELLDNISAESTA